MPFGDVPQFKFSEHTTHRQYSCPPHGFPSVASLQAPCEASRPEERDRPRAGKPEKGFLPLHLHPQVCIPIQIYASQLTNRDKRSMGARIKSTGYNVRPIEPGDNNWEQMLAREGISSTQGSQRGITSSRNITKKSLQNLRSVNRNVLQVVRAYVMHAYIHLFCVTLLHGIII